MVLYVSDTVDDVKAFWKSSIRPPSLSCKIFLGGISHDLNPLTTGIAYAIYENEEFIHHILHICSTKTDRSLDEDSQWLSESDSYESWEQRLRSTEYISAAGLYCGILLAEAGHTVTIFEANNRAGGRVFTYRDPKNPSKYIGDMGAMRFSLDAQPYLNHLVRQRYKLNITEIISSNDNAFKYINGIFATHKQARENPDIFQFNTSQNERGKTSDQLFSEAVKPIQQTLLEEGWSSIQNKWDSYSIESYLHKMNLSRAAIDYIAIASNYESNSFTAILERIEGRTKNSSSSRSYRISNGSDLLIQSMVNDCQTMKSNRCSIHISTPVIKVELLPSNRIRLTTNISNNQIFDTVVVATTPTVTHFIEFEPRIDFVQKYLAMRQVNYICASKIYLFFNTSWWYTQENINGGSSDTDLPIRNINYPTMTNNQTDGGAILASYTFSKDSIAWQSLSESDAIELALRQLIQLHRNSSNMRNYFQGGKAKHWCEDPYERGAMTLFTPFQYTELFDKLQASVSNIMTKLIDETNEKDELTVYLKNRMKASFELENFEMNGTSLHIWANRIEAINLKKNFKKGAGVSRQSSFSNK
ncbi:unnamed protein product [Rotaria sordida]|uniref:Amine oxidase domain-containing protein n=1 Tax=Rotaria sordida TaxID=392033 RepID=A0A813Z931_9BILA|nr:unnamed protein product [Rotaria sordida]